MSKIFFDEPSFELELPVEIDAIIARASENKFSFGPDKLRPLLACLTIHRLLTNTVAVIVQGRNADWLCCIIREAAETLAYNEVSVETSSVQALARAETHGLDLLIDLGSSEIDQLILLSRIVPHIREIGCIFFSVFADWHRNDATISRRTLIQRLSADGFRPLENSYYAAFFRGLPTNVVDDHRRVSPALQERCLFVVGHARSGSSLALHLLNTLPDVLISYEMNLQISKNRSSIIDNFNLVNQRQGRPRSKGFYLPPSLSDAGGTAGMFEYFLARYDYFGDKVAYGARSQFYERHPAVVMFNYFMERFPFARYLVTLREPNSAIAAMGRMRPELSLDLLFDFWLGGIIYVIDLILISDRAWVVFHSDLVSGKISPIEQAVGRSLDWSRAIIDLDEVTTSGQAIDVFWTAQGAGRANELVEASKLFAEVEGLFNPDVGTYRSATGRGELEKIRSRFALCYSRFLDDFPGAARD